MESMTATKPTEMSSIQSFVPYFLIAGFVVPIPFFFLHKAFPRVGLDKINIALLSGTMYLCIQGMIHPSWKWREFHSRRAMKLTSWPLMFKSITGVTSGFTMKMIMGITSQYYWKRYHPEWQVYPSPMWYSDPWDFTDLPSCKQV